MQKKNKKREKNILKNKKHTKTKQKFYRSPAKI